MQSTISEYGLPEYAAEQEIFGASNDDKIINYSLSSPFKLIVSKTDLGYKVSSKRDISMINDKRAQSINEPTVVNGVELVTEMPIIIDSDSEDNEIGFNASQYVTPMNAKTEEFEAFVAGLESRVDSYAYLLSYEMVSYSPFRYGYKPEDLISVSTDVYK
jgi:hypothetical protein